MEPDWRQMERAQYQYDNQTPEDYQPTEDDVIIDPKDDDEGCKE